jgi:hypothetical protein
MSAINNIYMTGTLVESNSPLKWVPFMIRYQVSSSFFGIIKKYKYAYVHPSLDYLPKNLYELRIGDVVEFFLETEIHAVLHPLDANKLYHPLNKKQ